MTTTVNFVSVGFTLRVWRGWIQNRVIRIRKTLRLHLRVPARRVYWVFGSARSGTTWLMEVLQRGFNLHSLHEPTFRHNPDFPRSDLDTKVLIARSLDDLGIPRDWLWRLVSGKVSNSSVDRSNSVISLRRRDGVVLKDIDVRQLQISALTGSHPEVTPVIILRQPFSALKSVIPAQKAWKHDYIFHGEYLKEFRANNAGLLSPGVLEIIAAAEQLLTRLDYRQVWIAKWCVENLVALEMQASNPQTKVVLYERMMQPEEQALAYLEGIFGEFQRNPRLMKRSKTDLKLAPASTPEMETETAAVLEVFGLGPFTLPEAPHLLDFEALVADYRKPASDRLTPRFMR